MGAIEENVKEVCGKVGREDRYNDGGCRESSNVAKCCAKNCGRNGMNTAYSG